MSEVSQILIGVGLVGAVLMGVLLIIDHKIDQLRLEVYDMKIAVLLDKNNQA